MKQSKLDLSHIRLQVARGLALGLSQEKIAKEVYSSQATISRFSRKPDFQKEVLRQKKRLVRRAPDAVEKLLAILDSPRCFDPTNEKKLAIGYQACWTILMLCYVLKKDGKGVYVTEIQGKAIDLIVKKIMRKQ